MYRPNCTVRAARLRLRVVREDWVLGAPREVPPRGRYRDALAAGWRPLG